MANLDTADSKAQYVRKLKQWRLEKNSTKEKWEFAASQVQKRRLEGKETEVIINGRPVPAKKLKEMARYASCESSLEKALGKSCILPIRSSNLAAPTYKGTRANGFGLLKAAPVNGSCAVTVQTPPAADMFRSIRYTQIPWFQFQDLLDSCNSLHPSLAGSATG